jgi:hypothetical protein
MWEPGVDAAAGDDEGHLSALGEAFVAGGEGLADADDVVDPGLEDGGDGEVVHGGGDDDLVGGKELRNELVGDLEGGFLLRRVLVGGGVGAGDPREVNEGEGGLGEVADDDVAVMGLLPLLGELGGELAGDGVFAAWAGVDLQ